MDVLKVSVIILTYNHEKFVAQALESILEQQVNFAYEILISDDFSSDNTRSVLADYQTRYPDKICLRLNEENLGPHANFEQTFLACQGQYIAYLDGDDYWTSLEKLQKQVDFLDTHLDCTLCFHNAKSVSAEYLWEPVIYCPPDLPEILTIKDLFFANIIPSASVMYRRGVVPDLPGWMSKLKLGDWPLYLLHAQKGSVGFIDEVIAVYRIHDGGIWSSMQETSRCYEAIKMLETINYYFDYQYETVIGESITVLQEKLIEASQQPIRHTLNELEQKYQWEQSQCQNQIQHLQGGLDYSRSLLAQSQSELAQSQSELARSQSQLSQSQGVLAYAQSQLLQTQSEAQAQRARSHSAQMQINDLKARLKHRREKFQQKQAELKDCQSQVTAMESSKFWRMRKGWLKLKRLLGLAINE